MSDPADIIVPLLREMRAENLEQHEQTRALVMALETPLDHEVPLLYGLTAA